MSQTRSSVIFCVYDMHGTESLFCGLGRIECGLGGALGLFMHWHDSSRVRGRRMSDKRSRVDGS